MIPKKAKNIIGTLLAAVIVLTSPSIIWGKETSRVMTIQDNCGLVVKLAQQALDLGNLNPGDYKESSIQVTNQGTNDITLFMRTNILNESTLKGGYLADIMDYTIKIKKDIIAQAPFRDVVDQGNLLIGRLKPGTSKTIELATFLPGQGTGNQYQGAYMKVNWTFVTQCATVEDGNDIGDPDKGSSTSGNTSNDPGSYTSIIEVPSDWPEEITIGEDPLPLGTIEPVIEDEPTQITDEPTILIEDEPIPYGSFKMPKTGELASTYYYLAGSLMMMLGIYFRKK